MALVGDPKWYCVILCVLLCHVALISGQAAGEDIAGKVFYCPEPQSQLIPISNECDGEADCIGLHETTNCENGESSCKKTADELNCVPKSDLKCPSDLFVMVEGANDKMCYHMRDIDIGTASFFEAKKYCEETIGDMVRPKKVFIARPNSYDQLRALRNWALRIKKVPNVKNGFWLGYIQLLNVLLADGNITQEHRQLRRGDVGYFGDYVTATLIPDIWRRTQPYDHNPGEETCVAKKKLHVYKHRGADTYKCEGPDYTPHYVMCETLAVPKGK